MKIIYMLGVTCAGKDYLSDHAVAKYPDTFGAVNVGKEFRRRYPPGYFQGKGAMASTEDEVYEIFTQQLEAASKKPFVLVSGQPRLVSQVDRIFAKFPGSILWLHQPDSVLLDRLEKRFVDSPDAIHLAKERLLNDRIQLFDVLFELVKRNVPIEVARGNVDDTLNQILTLGGPDLYV